MIKSIKVIHVNNGYIVEDARVDQVMDRYIETNVFRVGQEDEFQIFIMNHLLNKESDKQ